MKEHGGNSIWRNRPIPIFAFYRIIRSKFRFEAHIIRPCSLVSHSQLVPEHFVYMFPLPIIPICRFQAVSCHFSRKRNNMLIEWEKIMGFSHKKNIFDNIFRISSYSILLRYIIPFVWGTHSVTDLGYQHVLWCPNPNLVQNNLGIRN